MKNLFVLFLLASGALQVSAQTMKWIPLEPGTTLDKCKCASSKLNEYRCYVLQYIPAVSGTLTSYTTGFFVSCTSKGSAIAKNQSCSMANNVNLIDGCQDTHQILMNSSGNSGIAGVNKIEAGKPVYLHQVCFSIPWGEEITVMKDDLTDLTTSIDMGNGQVMTEMPVYITQNIGRPRYDAELPNSLVDFVTRVAGEHTSQLDWSASGNAKPVSFVIEHGVDGINFKALTEVKAKTDPEAIQAYQYLDKAAVEGLNFYRLKIFNDKGQYEYSPIRIVNFAGGDFAIKTWPSPASESVHVFINHAGVPGKMELTDSNGKKFSELQFGDGNSDHEMSVSDLAPGVYSLIVVSGSQRAIENVVVVH